MMRPKILCLHGSGTNAAIFAVQSRKLAALLAPHFDLVYVDAPLECGPGPGVLPFFEGAGPFRRWLFDERPGDLSPSADAAGDERNRGEGGERERVDLHPAESMDFLLATYRSKGPFVGVLAFSQGAKAGMLLLRRVQEERAKPNARPAGRGERVLTLPDFMVAVCGTAPFQGVGYRDDEGNGDGDGDLASAERAWNEERRRGFKESLAKGVVNVESIHVIGERDPWRPESEALVEFFDADNRRVIRFDGEHQMPVDYGVNTLLANLMVSAYEGL